MSDGHIEVRDHGAVRVLIFQRPERKNAFTRAMYTQINAALDDAAEAREVRAVLFTGAGDAFSAGNDLMDFMQDPPTGEDSPVFGLLKRLVSFEKPMVAAVNGAAIGIGTTLLLHCDLAYTADNATFQMPFVPLGLVPEAASSLFVPMMVGHVKAAELLLLGEKFTADAAERMGFVNAVVPAAQLMETALAKAIRLAALPPGAVKQSKALMRRAQKALVAETMTEEGRVFVERLASPETSEAIQAFFEKRAPDFSKFS
ncbi:MAG: enoyl-CoA hydratase [Bradymonadia bacterium]